MLGREKPLDGGRSISGGQTRKRSLEVGHGARRRAEEVAREHDLLNPSLPAGAEPHMGLDQPARGSLRARENAWRRVEILPFDERLGTDILTQNPVGKVCLERGYRTWRGVELEPVRQPLHDRALE
jgi:hypothetical protein